MNEEEQQLMKVSAEAAMRPFANLLERLFGGVTDEIGGMWQDALKVRRQVRQLSLYTKLKAQIEEAGFEPRPIPDKIWLPILQSATVEDDEFLQDKWASLLANLCRSRYARAKSPDGHQRSDLT